MIETPKPWRIILTDYTAFMAFLLPAVFGGIYLVLWITGEDVDQAFAYVTLALGVAGILLLVWRLQAITSTFREGIELPAVVSGVGSFRDRCTVTCTYTHQGQKYESSNTVLRTQSVRALQQGQRVTAVVNPAKPSAAFIKELYL